VCLKTFWFKAHWSW